MLISSLKARFLSLLLLSFSNTLVHAITPVARGESECGLMPSQATIYCYGGQMIELTPGYGDDAPTAILSDLFITLNLTQNTTVASLQNAWERLGSDVGSNFYPAFAVIPQHDMIFMDGGRGAGNNGQTLARYRTTIYNTDTGSWSTDTPSRNGIMIQTHTATLGQDNNTLYVWGGFRDQSTGLSLTVGIEYPLEMYMFDIQNSQWTTGNPVGSLDATRVYHKAVRIGTRIYYIGGVMPLSIEQFVDAPMDLIPIYDTDSGQWRTQRTTGPIPRSRIRHTATLLPNNNEILVFGGHDPSNNTIYCPDYFYVLQVSNQQLIWTNTSKTITIDGAGFNGLGIYGHSAVLAGNNLFFMFGRTLNVNFSIVANTLLVFDVNRWSWISSVSALLPEKKLTVDDSTDGSTRGGDNGTVSKGTIAGAVVGGVIGVSLIAGVLFFFLRRKRNQLNNNNNNNEKNGCDIAYNNNMPYPPSEAPPPQYYVTDQHNNVYQPVHTNVPHSVDGGSRVDARSPTSTEYASWQDRSTNYSSEKPDAPPVSPDFSDTTEPVVQRLVMQPVKPDGV
ncbi:hypothetical protein BDA99DRAFT_601414 [Phascolomyces articulosus]|uniref:Attractin/MKLN-like beta-propeller domain-containing protein n=1 Tax=Phascolomyces articulosus TaxID=60185 RepID=A0AAD5KND9_9FUNG|nr:hypothetical protein BDA99DRAFT_601414 [Phascolomyces articulosus]